MKEGTITTNTTSTGTWLHFGAVGVTIGHRMATDHFLAFCGHCLTVHGLDMETLTSSITPSIWSTSGWGWRKISVPVHFLPLSDHRKRECRWKRERGRERVKRRKYQTCSFDERKGKRTGNRESFSQWKKREKIGRKKRKWVIYDLRREFVYENDSRIDLKEDFTIVRNRRNTFLRNVHPIGTVASLSESTLSFYFCSLSFHYVNE